MKTAAAVPGKPSIEWSTICTIKSHSNLCQHKRAQRGTEKQPTDFPLTFSSCSSVAAVHGDRYFVILHFYTFNMGLSLFACHQAQLIDWQITLYKTDEATKRLTRRLLRTFEQKHLLSKTKVR